MDNDNIIDSTHPLRSHVINELNSLVCLPMGWDGYRAKPVSLDNAEYALSIFDRLCHKESPIPQIVPGIDGDLQLEWHIGNTSIEIHIVSPNNIYIWTNDKSVCPDGQEIHICGL
jgi:hypothetical protein